MIADLPQRLHRRRLQSLSHHPRGHRLGGLRRRRPVEPHRLLGRPPDHLSAPAAGGPRAFQPGPLTARAQRALPRLCERALRNRAASTSCVRDPQHSIHFNDDPPPTAASSARGTSAATANCSPVRMAKCVLVSLAEKLLVPLLVKLSNLVPGGGIWLNTQRPEWNDANNALAGWGLSVVTVCYLRRYLAFLDRLFDDARGETFELSAPVAELLAASAKSLPLAVRRSTRTTPRAFAVTEALGRAGESHRRAVYAAASSPSFTHSVRIAAVREFIAAASPRSMPRSRPTAATDGCSTATTCWKFAMARRGRPSSRPDARRPGRRAEQRLLDAAEALGLLVALRDSALYRADQHSYLLYPDREIAPFLERNTLPADWQTQASPRLAESVVAGDRGAHRARRERRARISTPDLTNARDLEAALDALAADPAGSDAVRADRAAVLELWEQVFHHRAFTGRSGAMFAFEGLGSIYWHMVAKLLLAVQEMPLEPAATVRDAAETRLCARPTATSATASASPKTPEDYGAFPTDPYSHTPRHRGAQQPGMTGQVKEEILTRMGELGVVVDQRLRALRAASARAVRVLRRRRTRSITSTSTARIADLEPRRRARSPSPCCQVPVCYRLGDDAAIVVRNVRTAAPPRSQGNALPPTDSRDFSPQRGAIDRVRITVTHPGNPAMIPTIKPMKLSIHGKVRLRPRRHRQQLRVGAHDELHHVLLHGHLRHHRRGGGHDAAVRPQHGWRRGLLHRRDGRPHQVQVGALPSLPRLAVRAAGRRVRARVHHAQTSARPASWSGPGSPTTC